MSRNVSQEPRGLLGATMGRTRNYGRDLFDKAQPEGQIAFC